MIQKQVKFVLSLHRCIKEKWQKNTKTILYFLLIFFFEKYKKTTINLHKH